MLSLWAVAPALFVLSVVFCGVYRQMAAVRQWVDVPNHRSSHVQIVPRGAGIVFALLIGLAAVLAAIAGEPIGLVAGVLCGVGIAVAGWWDDLRGVPALWRFCLYWIISVISIALMAWSTLEALQIQLLLMLLAYSVALQWLINLYNFMDGINGIAAAEAIFVLCAMLVLGPKAGGIVWLSVCSIAALCGFLVWNFPVARIFMGDSGSAFLGFLLGLMVIWSCLRDGSDLLVWLILLGVFVVDATYTLLVRMVTGQEWLQGHRLHAYQILARNLGSHTRVVGAVFLVNIFWLLPWAWVARERWLDPHWALVLAYLPLVLVCCVTRAGNLSPTRV